MYKWAKKYGKYLNLPQLGKELNIPLKQENLKTFLDQMVADLPSYEDELSEEELYESTHEYYSLWIINTLKNYYVIIASIPLVLGGGYQLIRLMRVGDNFMRFFSASQLLIDGLIISIYLAVFILSLLLLTGLFILYHEKKWIFFYISFTFTLFIISSLIKDFDSLKSLDFDFNLKTNLLTLGVILSLVISTIKNLNKFIKGVLQIIAFILFSWILTLFLNKSMTSFINMFSLEGIKNEKNIECELNKNNIDFDNYEIQYYNDKYIFISLDHGQDNEIIIYPFEILFNDNCN